MTGRWGAPGKATGLISGGGDQDQVARALKATEEKLPAAWVAQVPNLCKAMAQMAGRWNRVPVGGELVVTWRPRSQSSGRVRRRVDALLQPRGARAARSKDPARDR